MQSLTLPLAAPSSEEEAAEGERLDPGRRGDEGEAEREDDRDESDPEP